MDRPRLVLKPRGLFPVKLSRLLDHEWFDLSDFAAPIERNHRRELRIALLGERLVLPKVFLAAEVLFGRSYALYDEHKCSFSFPLLLTAVRDGVALRYVVVLGDVRGSVKLPFYRMQEERMPRSRAYHPPVERELSRAEIDDLTDFILGYLVGRGEVVAAAAPSFYRVVRSEFLVYGKRRGDLFECSREDVDSFEALVEGIEAELGDFARAEESDRIEKLLARISE